jgi:aldehyde dehydrogenase (NAD+)
MREFGLYIDGGWQPAASGETFASINPATEEPWALVAAAGQEDVDRAVAVAKAAHASGVWRNTPARERADVISKAADLLVDRQEELVLAEVSDGGGTFRKANIADIPATMQALQYYAQLIRADVEETTEEEVVPVPSKNIIRKEPIGVIGAIVPFNFPMAAASWKIAPALAAGNTLVMKPSPYTPTTTLLLAEIFTQAGLPDGVFNVLCAPGPEIGSALVSHPDTDKIAFTGSTKVGKLVLRAAAEQLKPVILELGGKSANIILKDANLEGAVRGALFGTFFHSGQVCESGTRVLVDKSIYGTFVEMMAEGVKAIRVGDPMDMMTTMGPVISAQQRDNIERYVAIGKDEGARLVCGGKRPEELPVGYYYEPTIFDRADNDMTIAREEIFGPVVTIIPFDDEEQALALANDSMYGLGGAVWTTDIDRGLAMARKIESGTVWVNDYHLINPRFPFGGYKKSGYGRELGPQGLAEYQQLKHIHLGEATGAEEKYYFGMLLD